MVTNVPLERYKLDRSEQFDREKMAQSARQQDKKLAFAEKSAQKKMDRSERQAAGMMAYKGYKGTAGHIADGLDKHAAGMREDAKGRRKNGWEYAMEGLTEGLSTGLKMSAENEKIAKIMEYFKQTGDAAAQMNEYHEEKQQFQKSMEPSAQAAVSLAYSGKPYEVVDPVMRDLWNTTQANNKGLTGTYIGYVPNTSDIIVRDPEGNQQLVSLGEFAGKDYTKSQYEKSLLEQAEAVEARHQELQERKLSATERRNEIMEGGLDARLEAIGVRSAKDILPRALASHSVKVISEKIIKDAKEYPQIFGGAISAYMNTGGDAVALKLWADKSYTNPKDRDAAMRIAKSINQIKVADIKSLGGSGNLTVDKMIENMYPTLQYSPENFLEIMEEIHQKADYTEKIYRDALHGRSAAHLGESFDRNTATPEPQMKSAKSTSPSNPITLTPEESQNAGKAVMPAKPEGVPENYVLMYDPISGKEGFFSPEQAEIAQQNGAIRREGAK